jgi:hypothetical protein
MCVFFDHATWPPAASTSRRRRATSSSNSNISASISLISPHKWRGPRFSMLALRVAGAQPGFFIAYALTARTIIWEQSCPTIHPSRHCLRSRYLIDPGWHRCANKYLISFGGSGCTELDRPSAERFFPFLTYRCRMSQQTRSIPNGATSTAQRGLAIIGMSQLLRRQIYLDCFPLELRC